MLSASSEQTALPNYGVAEQSAEFLGSRHYFTGPRLGYIYFARLRLLLWISLGLHVDLYVGLEIYIQPLQHTTPRLLPWMVWIR